MLIKLGSFRTDCVNKETSAKYPDIEIDDYKEKREEVYKFYISGTKNNLEIQ